MERFVIALRVKSKQSRVLGDNWAGLVFFTRSLLYSPFRRDDRAAPLAVVIPKAERIDLAR